MKKKWILATAVLLAAVLFVPVPGASYDDGGTREFTALTYKIVRWHKITDVEGEPGIYRKTRFYPFADRDASIDELWEREMGAVSEILSDAKPVIYLYPDAEGCRADLTAKPVIYLQTEEASAVSVKLDYNGSLTHTYPAYNGGWEVLAYPDGTIVDPVTGREHYCLFWEGVTEAEYDFSRGFCVAGEDTAAFLEDSLRALGLSDKEANEFIIYWLPQMEQNAYNIISFQGEDYTENAKLNVEPEPDSILRVFMAWKPSEAYVEMEPQTFEPFVRKGFAVVEWGGCKVRE